METVAASIYDYPVYYDLVFGSDWSAEFHFLNAAIERHVDWGKKMPARSKIRLLEPACGTGRLLFRMAKSGAQAAGMDLNEKAIKYCNSRLRKNKLPETAWVADMCDFEVKKPYDAAFNTINSFRHLGSESAAIAHLTCMGSAIRPGGIYALGLHLQPLKGEQTEEESWVARRGNLQVNTQMWPRDKDRRKRIERYNIRFDIYQPTGHTRIDDCLVLRSYTVAQFNKLLAACPMWTIEETYDFRYSIDDPIELDGYSEDVVYILKRV